MRGFVLAALVLLAGCDNGRYQISARTEGGTYRVDTRTGEVAICNFFDGAELRCFHAMAEMLDPAWKKAPIVPQGK